MKFVPLCSQNHSGEQCFSLNASLPAPLCDRVLLCLLPCQKSARQWRAARPRADKMRGWEDAGAALPHLAWEVSALEIKSCDPSVSQEEGAPDLPVSLHKILMEVTSSGLGKEAWPVAMKAGESCQNLLSQGGRKVFLLQVDLDYEYPTCLCCRCLMQNNIQMLRCLFFKELTIFLLQNIRKD